MLFCYVFSFLQKCMYRKYFITFYRNLFPSTHKDKELKTIKAEPRQQQQYSGILWVQRTELQKHVCKERRLKYESFPGINSQLLEFTSEESAHCIWWWVCFGDQCKDCKWATFYSQFTCQTSPFMPRIQPSYCCPAYSFLLLQLCFTR